MQVTAKTTGTAATLVGVVEAVSFFSSDSGYSVLRVKVDRSKPCTVVGITPAVNVGEWVKCTGKWVEDPEYGRQFRAEILWSTPPETKAGLIDYLSSGCIPGIDPEIAHNLVRAFGTSVFDVIRKEPGRLVRIKGVDKERCELIRHAVNQETALKNIVLFLQEHGIPPGRTIRVLKSLGEDPIGQIQANPYCILGAGPGIDFEVADLIAETLGTPKDSPLRIQAGLEYTLLTAGDDGHCALPQEVLLNQTEKLLAIHRTLVAETLNQAIEQSRLSVETIEDLPLIFHPEAKEAESSIASIIGRLVREKATYPRFKVDKAIKWCEKQIDKTLESSQRAALQTAFTKRALAITGGPGVGKTTLVNSILKILAREHVRILLCAPTGSAAKRLAATTEREAATIHRLLESNPSTGLFNRNEECPLICDLLIVDESSMVDVYLMDALLRALPKNAAVILIGDVDQLPSVGPGCVLRDLIESGVVPVARLTRNHRQGVDSKIVTVAQSILDGEVPEFDNDPASDCFFIERSNPEDTLATLIAVVKERIPKSRGFNPVVDIQVLSPMHLGQVGVKSLNQSLQQALNPVRPGRPHVDRDGYTFHPNDKVIQTENNYEKEVFNGDIGLVGGIDKKKRRVTIGVDERTIPYSYADLDSLSLAYAITIHKSQGSEFPAVVIPLSMQHRRMLQRNLIYTAITRGKNMLVIIGEKRALETAIANDKTQKRYTGLKQRLQAMAA